jgi:hypothetical protein
MSDFADNRPGLLILVTNLFISLTSASMRVGVS